MKPVLLFLLAVTISFAVPNVSKSQLENFVLNAPDQICADVNTDAYTNWPYFPMSNDTLRALVVFVNYPSPWGDWEIPGNPSVFLNYWPGSSSQDKPTWADSVICPTTTNIWNPSLTGLFKASSNGKFLLIGDVYPELIILDHQPSYYSPDSSRRIGHAVKEVIEKIDDEVDWSLYDKFSPFNAANKRQPDGIVDFIFIVFRFNNSSITDPGSPPSYSGIACLGGRNGIFGNTWADTVYTTHDGKRIRSDFPGSGCISEMQNKWALGVASHEFAEHHSYGGNHSEVMGVFNINGGNLASAYDRTWLGWNFGTAYQPTSNTTINLKDFVTQGDYIKISRTSDVIYIENRGRYNYYSSESYKQWKWGPNDPLYPTQPDSGLVIYRHFGGRSFKIQSANGNWNWKKCQNYYYNIIYNSPTHNIWFHDTPNRLSGQSTFDLIGTTPVRDLNCNPIPHPFHWNPSAILSESAYHGLGGDSNTCFDVGYNQIYSPWSNPALPVNNTNDSLLVEITGLGRQGEMSVKLYFNNLLDAPPSKPTGVRGEYYADPMLADYYLTAVSWAHNIEPDMLRTGDLKRYKIYRGISANMNEPTSYSYLTTVDIHKDSVPYYIDTITAAGTHVGGPPPPVHYLVGYKIMAVDNTSQESILSDRGKVTAVSPNNCNPCENEDNISIGENQDKQLSIKNFPNPFNPTTILQYNLPNDGFVSLKIYDITGREIAVLINEFKPKGNYDVMFNASKYGLSSGVYFYRFSAMGQTFINRLLLIK